MPPRGGNPVHIPPAPRRPAPVVSARGNVGATQPHGTAKLAPAPVVSARGNVGASQPHGTAKLSRGGTDAQSSGPDYGGKAADLFKQTKAYRQAVASVFAHQPTPQKAAILTGLMRTRNAFKTPEGQAIKSVWLGMPVDQKIELQHYLPHTRGINVGGLIDRSLAGAANLLGDLGKNQINSEQNVALGGVTPAGVSQVLTHAPFDVARAAVQDPSVLPKTAKGFADSVVGAVAGTVELPYRVVDQGPGKALSQFGSSIASDYKRRYGPLASGNDQAFIDRIKKEGAGPEVFDALIAGGGLDATAGRAIADIGKSKAALSGAENVFTRERPNLLISGGKTRSQALGSTAGRIAAQRLEDKLRTVRTEKRPGELTPKEGQVAPIFQSHAIRVVHSGIAQGYRRMMQETLKKEVRGHNSAALTAIGKLNHWQKQAVYHAIHGIRVDTATHFREDLAARYKQIAEDRANPASLGRRIPAQLADKVDEVALINRLMAHADDIAGPKMVAFQKGEAERSARISAATNLHPATADARILRDTADRLGIEHPDIATAREIQALKKREKAIAGTVRRPGTVGELQAARAALKRVQGKIATLSKHEGRTHRLAAYVKQVRAKMDERGLPEPGYFKHAQHPETKFGDFTSGSGHRAMPADKMSTWALHRAGVADHSPQAYLNGLARSVKRPYQWRLTDEQFRAAALPTPTRAEIKAALGRDKAPHRLTGHELRWVLSHRGVDPAKVSFYNPGRLAEQTLADHGILPKGKQIGADEEQISGELHNALQQDGTVYHGNKSPTDKFLTTQGWKAVPSTAFDEIHAGLKGSSLGGRVVGKLQGTQAGLILGQNPHFLIMNTLAHAFPAIAATKGALIPDLVKAPFWWHGLSEAEKARVQRFEGGRGGHYNVTARLGSTAPNRIAEFGRKLEQNGLAQKAKLLNPLHAVLRAEDTQSNFFRHAVMYHEIKRMAFQDMAHEYGHAVAGWEQVKHIFDLGPQARMKAIVENMTKLEDLGRTAVNILGDYGRFTARERAFLNNRAVMFYSFIRHVTRTLLYVLPVRHPLAFGLMGELGNLHVEEVKKMLGGEDLPWAYGRVFFDPKNKLKSIDLTSTSPISSPLVDLLSGGISQAPRLMSPLLQTITDIAYGKTAQGAPVKQNAWSLLNDVFSLSYPYRTAAAFDFGLKSQQSDSVPLLHERPQVLKTAKSQAYAQAKQQARGPLKDYLLGSLLGVYPKPDDSKVIAQHRAQLAASKAGGSAKKGRYLAPASKASGGYLMGGNSSGASSSGYLMHP